MSGKNSAICIFKIVLIAGAVSAVRFSCRRRMWRKPDGFFPKKTGLGAPTGRPAQFQENVVYVKSPDSLLFLF